MSGAVGGEATSSADWVFHIDVRYGDCDMQGIVFNAHYLSYVDHVLDMWFRDRLGTDYLERFEFMVKRAVLDWDSPARAHETISARPSVTRWGRTSFDVAVDLDVAGRKVARAELVYVSITPGTHEPTPVPGDVRAALTG